VATATPEHPNLPRRGALGLMFFGIALSGMLGGLIGYGLVKTSCADTPTRAERLLQVVPNFHAHVASCTLPEFLAAFVGTVFTAIGAGIIAVLIVRAQSEWRGHPAGRVSRSGPGGTPPRT
jgi:hypothetical protein